MTPAPAIGVLLAAGRGRRMGPATKQLLPWPVPGGHVPLVAAAFDALRARCGAMVVVLGHECDAVAAALAPRAYHTVTADPDAEMMASIRSGLEAALALDAAAEILLHPADVPVITAAAMAALGAARRAHPDRAIMPEHAGRGGHPVAIPPALVPTVIGHAGAGGLRGLWRDRPDLCVRVAVDEPSVALDLNTPEAYRAATAARG